MEVKISNKSDIIVCGDIHAEWKHLNNLINKKKPAMILQCGDFGWWPELHGGLSSYEKMLLREHGIKRKPFDQYGLRNGDIPIYFCPGNHEDWNSLDYKEAGGEFELIPNVFYQPFGSTITLPDGRVVMFCGGATSIDQEARILNRDWFEQEIITYSDMEKLPPKETRIDIVISHTCPVEFFMQMVSKKQIYYNQYSRYHKDPSRDALSYVRDTYKPSLWYFGHFHKYIENTWKETRWFALNMPRITGWWTYLMSRK